MFAEVVFMMIKSDSKVKNINKKGKDKEKHLRITFIEK